MSLIASLSARLSRAATAFRRRNPKVRHWIPRGWIGTIQATRSRMSEAQKLYVPVQHRAAYRNVFHCAVQKTGSQWIKSLLTDPRTFEFSGYTHYHYQSRAKGDRRWDQGRATEREIRGPFPDHSVVSPLYISYDVYDAIPKEGETRAFFVMRDPRDLIVSWYFSAKKNHIIRPGAEKPLTIAREALAGMTMDEGLIYAIDYFQERGRFEALASWADRGTDDPEVLLVRYEDFVGPNSVDAFQRLFEHIDIQYPEDVMLDMLEAYSFEKLSGRKKGTVDTSSHLRSGKAGGWKKHFTPEIERHFTAVAGDLPVRLGYEPFPVASDG